jgi:hypothetical protein
VFNDKNAFAKGITLWDNSTAYISIDQNGSIPTLNVDSGSHLRLGPVAGSYFTVQDLSVGVGGHITSNSSTGGGSKNIVVEDSLTAGANSAIQWGVIDVSGPPPGAISIDVGCQPYFISSDVEGNFGLGSDLCDNWSTSGP